MNGNTGIYKLLLLILMLRMLAQKLVNAIENGSCFVEREIS